MAFETSGTEKARITTTGEFLIGVTVPGGGTPILQARRDQDTNTLFRVDNASSGASASADITVTTGAGLDIQGVVSAVVTGAFVILGSSTAATGGVRIRTGTTAPISFLPNGVEAARFLSTGEFVVGATTLTGTELGSFQKNQNALTYVAVSNTTSGTLAQAALTCRVGAGRNMQIGRTSAGFTPINGIQAAEGYISNDFGDMAIANTDATGSIRLINNSIEGWKITTLGIVASINRRFSYGTAALAVGDTEGDLFIQSCAGTPTGVPASIPTGQKAVRYDSTAKKLWIYDGAWLRGQVAGVDVVWA